jgi:hypothetical protein
MEVVVEHNLNKRDAAFNVPGVKAIALNTTHANRVKENVDMTHVDIPVRFWKHWNHENLFLSTTCNGFNQSRSE